MKQTILIAISLSFILNSFTKRIAPPISKTVTIAGRILNYDKNSGKNAINIYVNDHGQSKQLNYISKIDSTGYFNVKFERDFTQDVLISYRTNFRVIVHPGDSLFITFNGDTNSRNEILKTVTYSGDAAELNTKFSKYNKTYFEMRPNQNVTTNKQKNYTTLEYKHYQDSIKTSREIRRDRFILEHNPDKELLQWINASIELSYYNEILNYPSSHNKLNNIAYADIRVDKTDYNVIKNMPILRKTFLINTESKQFINYFLHYYVYSMSKHVSDSIPIKNYDSLYLNKAIELTSKQPLIQQLVLNEMVNERLNRYDATYYENNQTTINNIIKEDFLIAPLKAHYLETKNKIANPTLAKNITINNVTDKSVKNIWEKILAEGKGKVIYLDCWGTWCAPCIKELPNSKKMMENYKGKNVEFVYLSFKSDKKSWTNVLSENKLEGKHYFLNDAQSTAFANLLNINSYPTYIIIDKEGKIIRSDSSYRPLQQPTEDIINELL
ncbi:TlpA family protein disulfide reductase [Mariniflexile gromovii]|uniref:TlpA family protein disulfide reductase n=1 Tax=Mariniflexile gromovii TaxID=362523 RepID=A0ABS4BT30_9FLAO|nr:TlpA disulfide reductase family protein [Mariniflexile gromovii]MBP0903568.1 TlpA family protein disulfide reductase [Mariniflexile gromovii]